MTVPRRAKHRSAKAKLPRSGGPKECHAILPMRGRSHSSVQAIRTLASFRTRLSDDEAAVYEFCIQLHRTRNVDDATFNRALALFGERGVVDLIGVSGYYTTVSMTLNVAHVMPPEGTALPLK